MKKVIAKRENGGVNVRREEPRICKKAPRQRVEPRER